MKSNWEIFFQILCPSFSEYLNFKMYCGHHRRCNGSENCALNVDASLGSKHCCLAQGLANCKSSEPRLTTRVPNSCISQGLLNIKKSLHQSIVQMRVLTRVLDLIQLLHYIPYSHEQKLIWISNTACY